MIYVFAGHVADKTDPDYDPGASANGFVEADLSATLRNKVANLLKAAGAKVTVDSDGDSLKAVLAKTDSSEKDVIFDIHWNAGVAGATGTEVFIPDRHTDFEKKFAKKIVDSIGAIMGLKVRGVKTEAQSARKRLGVMRPLGINMLVEICFLTNKSDMEKYLNNIDIVAKAISNVLIEAENAMQ